MMVVGAPLDDVEEMVGGAVVCGGDEGVPVTVDVGMTAVLLEGEGHSVVRDTCMWASPSEMWCLEVVCNSHCSLSYLWGVEKALLCCFQHHFHQIQHPSHYKHPSLIHLEVE